MNRIKSWRYQVLKHTNADGSLWYGVHEVFIDEDGKIVTYTEYPTVVGDDFGSVIGNLKLIYNACSKTPIGIATLDENEKSKPKPYNNVLDAVQQLIYSEDDTGCSDDLTVVSKSAVEYLRQIFRVK